MLPALDEPLLSTSVMVKLPTFSRMRTQRAVVVAGTKPVMERVVSLLIRIEMQVAYPLGA